MAKISDIMETEPYTCKASSTIEEVIRILSEGEVVSMPIVDDDMHLLGYITDVDLMRFIGRKRPQVFDWVDMMPVIVDDESFQEKVNQLLNTPILSVSSHKNKVFARPHQEIDEVAQIFRNEKMRKIAVVENGKVIGVVSREVILRHILTMILPDTHKNQST